MAKQKTGSQHVKAIAGKMPQNEQEIAADLGYRHPAKGMNKRQQQLKKQ